MSFTITTTRDDVTPDLRAKLAVATRPEGIWRAVGQQIVSITKRSFREPGLRQTPWPARRDGQPSNLIKKGMLLSSIRVTTVTREGVGMGSDRKYAAIHQLGGVIKAKGKPLTFMSGGKLWRVKQVKIPARPFFPFTPAGDLAPQHKPKVLAIADRAARLALGI